MQMQSIAWIVISQVVLASAPASITYVVPPHLQFNKVRIFLLRVCQMWPLFQKFQRMPGLSGSICIFLVLTGKVPGAVGLAEGASPSCPKPTTEWSTAFEQADAIPLVKGKLLSTIPALGKQWRVSLEVFPENFDRKGPSSALGSILLMSTGERLGRFGKLIPAVWIHRSKAVVVSTALGKKPIFTKRFRSKVPALGNWTQIEVSQSRQGEDYKYAVKIGGTQVYSATNSRPRDFYDVKVYSSSPLSPTLAGSIRNLKIEVATSSSMKEGISFNILASI